MIHEFAKDDKIPKIIQYYNRLSIKDQALSRILMLLLHDLSVIESEVENKEIEQFKYLYKTEKSLINKIVNNTNPSIKKNSSSKVHYKSDNIIYINFASPGGN